MKQTTFTSEFSIYKIRTSNLYIAIPQAFVRVIRQYLTEYKGLSAIPGDVRVKGFFLGNAAARDINTNSTASDIAVNQLSF